MSDLNLQLDLALRLFGAAVLGAIVGFERERHDHPAGIRTHMLVSVGAAAFTALSIYSFGGGSDSDRVAAQIVTGIGFLGAGAILKGQGTIHGLTTAASLWVVAAVGMAAGAAGLGRGGRHHRHRAHLALAAARDRASLFRPEERVRRLTMPRRALPLLSSPLIRRVAWHIRRIGGQLDRRFFLTLAEGIVVFVAVAAVLITLFEKPRTLESVFDSFNWGFATVLGQGDAGFVTSPGGRIVGWLLILFGVAMLGMITGALVAMVIDFLLKEGQGLGASGHQDHIVVCGWNSTARDLIDELRGDDYKQKVVVLADVDKNPAGSGVYFVRGDASDAADLERAGIADASAALVFPADGSTNPTCTRS